MSNFCKLVKITVTAKSYHETLFTVLTKAVAVAAELWISVTLRAVCDADKVQLASCHHILIAILSGVPEVETMKRSSDSDNRLNNAVTDKLSTIENNEYNPYI
jgi:hypothetical protein